MAFEAEFTLWIFIRSFLKSAAFLDGKVEVQMGTCGPEVVLLPHLPLSANNCRYCEHLHSACRCVIWTQSLTQTAAALHPPLRCCSRQLQQGPQSPIAAHPMFLHPSVRSAWHSALSPPYPECLLAHCSSSSPPPFLNVRGV